MTLLSSTDFITNLNEALENAGLVGAFGQVLFAIIVLIAVSVIMAYYKLPVIINLIVVVIGMLTFTAFGWFPLWVVVLITALIIGFLYIQVKGGATA